MFTDSHATLLSLQMASSNLTPWTSMCQHIKLNMKEVFQSNWLHEMGENQLLTDAFEEAKKQDFDSLIKLKELIIDEKTTGSLVSQPNHIRKFIESYQNSIGISLNVNTNVPDDPKQ